MKQDILPANSILAFLKTWCNCLILMWHRIVLGKDVVYLLQELILQIRDVIDLV